MTLFEKQAEEKYCKGCKSRMEQCLWAWRNTNGLNELKNCSCKEVPNYIRGAIDGYNKANEWHYVKDGDLPKHEVNVLVLFNKQCVDIAHYNYDYKEWHFADSIVRDVIAWCEIPKYTEE